MNTRPMSEVLAIILGHAEVSSSILVGADNALKLGDITRVEQVTADRMIGDWLRKNEELAFQNFQVKRQAFNQLIKETKANESFRVR